MSAGNHPASATRAAFERVGALTRGSLFSIVDLLAYIGGVTRLLLAVLNGVRLSLLRSGTRVHLSTVLAQCHRFGVRSIPIVILVHLFIGFILALNMAPTLALYGQTDQIATIVAIAIVREMGPLFTAILLTGLAGASIAAELGAMVEGEEIKALRAMALDPIRFLVAPRIIAAAIMMLGLTVIADVVGILGGMLTCVHVLNQTSAGYLDLTRLAITNSDYLTGLSKAFVFGVVVSGLACYEGLNVKGGSEGVGRATTTTVVKSIVALIATDGVFTAVYYALGV